MPVASGSKKRAGTATVPVTADVGTFWTDHFPDAQVLGTGTGTVTGTGTGNQEEEKTGLDWTGQDRAGLGWTGQHRRGQATARARF